MRKPVTITVEIEEEMIEPLEQAAREDPAFLGRVLLYGLTRRSIYRYLKVKP